MEMDTVDLIESFRQDCRLRGFSPKTCSVYPYMVSVFHRFLDGRSLLEVDKSIMKAYLSHLRETGLRQNSIKLTFTSLSSFYDFLEEEELIKSNPVRSMRKRYLHSYKDHDESQMRQLISVEQAANLTNSILDTRDRALVVMLLKTGMRINELLSLDAEDVDIEEMLIRIKPTAKRSNRIVYFDGETAEMLGKWLRAREKRNGKKNPALFLSRLGRRLDSAMAERLVARYAARLGLHDPASNRLEDRFTPHCCRHWFTTHLIRAGMSRDFVKELRGDVRHEAIDIYNHIDKKELRESYLAHIPQLGI